MWNNSSKIFEKNKKIWKSDMFGDDSKSISQYSKGWFKNEEE